MAVDISCPRCSQVMRIENPEEVVGTMARCAGCEETFEIQIPGFSDETPPDPSGGSSAWRQPGFLKAITSTEDTDAVAPGSIWKGVIEKIRGKFDAEQLRSMGRTMANVGTYAMIGGIVLYALYWVVAGLKGSLYYDEVLEKLSRKTDWYFMLFGLGSVVVLTAMQFVNQRLLGAIEGQIDSVPTAVSTTAVFDALGILFLVMAVSSPIYLIYIAFETKFYFMIFVGIAALVVFGYLTLVSLNPEFLNIHPDEEATAADDAMALYSFGVKVYISAIPFLYGILVVLGCAGLMLGMLQTSMEAEAVWVTAVHVGGVFAFHVALCLPFVGYLLGIFGLLSVFVLQAILSIPGKLDVLNKS